MQMAEAIEYLSDEAIDLDAAGESENIRYNEDDAINALILFMHITNNVAIHRYHDKGTPIERSMPHHIKQAKELRLWFMRMIGVDPHQYFGSQIPNEH